MLFGPMLVWTCLPGCLNCLCKLYPYSFLTYIAEENAETFKNQMLEELDR